MLGLNMNIIYLAERDSLNLTTSLSEVILDQRILVDRVDF